jgi:hypothetical protein
VFTFHQEIRIPAGQRLVRADLVIPGNAAWTVILALEALPEVQSAVLFIVGSLDKYLLEWNRQAIETFSCEKHLAIVQGATHFFTDSKIEVGSGKGPFRETFEKASA